MALNGGKSTFLSNDSAFVFSSTCFHFTSHILHVTHVLSFSLSFFLPLSFSLSFSTDNRQSSHAVHLFRLWRRPSESAKPCFSAEISLSPFSIFLQPACSSSLPSVIVYCSEYHSLYCSLTGLPGLQSLFPDLISLLATFSLFSLSSVSF